MSELKINAYKYGDRNIAFPDAKHLLDMILRVADVAPTIQLGDLIFIDRRDPEDPRQIWPGIDMDVYTSATASFAVKTSEEIFEKIKDPRFVPVMALDRFKK